MSFSEKTMTLNNYFKPLIILQLINIFSFNILTAQNAKGIVLDGNSKKPISAVNIYVKSQENGTTTNESGEFHLNHFNNINEKDTISFSHIGFSACKISFSELKLKGFVVFLSEDVQNISDVTIISTHKLKPLIHYNKLATLKEGLYSFGSLLLGNNIYVISGNSSFESNETLKAFSLHGEDFLKKHKANFSWQKYTGNMYVYDIPSDKWITSKLKFRKRAYHNINYFNEKIIISGGKRLSTNRKYEYLDETVEIYDIKYDTIIIDYTNPHQAVNFASVVYDNNLIVIGGSTKLKTDGKKEYSNKAHLLDLKTGYWYELNDMPLAKETKGVIINNLVYLIGGFNTNPLKEIETYNINTGEWKTESNLLYPVERPALTHYKDIIYIFEDGIIQTYNIKTKELNTFLIDLYLKYSELFFANDKLFIVGGFYHDEFSISPSPYLYSIELTEFKKTSVYSIH